MTRPIKPRIHLQHSNTTLVALTALSLLISLSLVSCGKPLLSPTDERSQYDRYDRVRNKYAPQFITDEYGREVPNLKGRLTPKK